MRNFPSLYISMNSSIIYFIDYGFNKEDKNGCEVEECADCADRNVGQTEKHSSLYRSDHSQSTQQKFED